MKTHKRCTEEQKIFIFKPYEAGKSIPNLAGQHGVAENTVYRWKSKFGGMEVSEAKRLWELEQLVQAGEREFERLAAKHNARLARVQAEC